MDQERLNASVSDLALTIGLLVRRVHTASPAHDLSWTQRAVISRLARNGAATISDLARAESVKPQSMGCTIAALEEKGIVERKPHPTDGRQFNIALTDTGAALREQIRAAKRTWFGETITQLSEQEQETLFAAGEIIKRMVEL
jgi:DNA-binding MarR family transcriptional regulator